MAGAGPARWLAGSLSFPQQQRVRYVKAAEERRNRAGPPHVVCPTTRRPAGWPRHPACQPAYQPTSRPTAPRPHRTSVPVSILGSPPRSLWAGTPSRHTAARLGWDCMHMHASAAPSPHFFPQGETRGAAPRPAAGPASQGPRTRARQAGAAARGPKGKGGDGADSRREREPCVDGRGGPCASAPAPPRPRHCVGARVSGKEREARQAAGRAEGRGG